MQMPDYDSFFRAYVDFYNGALAEKPVIGDLRQCYAEFIVGASPGSVMGGENGEEYGKVLDKGFGFYRAIGVTKMSVRRTEASEIMAGHDMIRVFFRADMRRKDGSEFPVDFEVVYIAQRRDGGPKIFAFMSDNELELFKKLGVVDAEGKPV